MAAKARIRAIVVSSFFLLAVGCSTDVLNPTVVQETSHGSEDLGTKPPADVAQAMGLHFAIGINTLSAADLEQVQISADEAAATALAAHGFGYVDGSGESHTNPWTDVRAVYLVLYQPRAQPHMTAAELAPRPAYLVQVTSPWVHPLAETSGLVVVDAITGEQKTEMAPCRGRLCQ